MALFRCGQILDNIHTLHFSRCYTLVRSLINHYYNRYSGVLASLNTTASFRSKCSTISLKIEDDRLSKAKSNKTQSVNKANNRNTEKESQKGGQKGKTKPVFI